MPHPRDKAKLTGDTHPPEVEDAGRAHEKDQAPGAAAGSGGGDATEDEARPGKGINQAGFLKEGDGGAGKGKP